MADDDSNLQLTITGEDAGASDMFTNVMARIESIEGSLRSMSSSGASSGEKIAAGMKEAAGSAAEAEGAFGKLGAGLNTVAGHARTAAMGLNALGLEADAGAVKVGALAEILDNIGGAVPGLLAIGAAIAAVSAGFSFIKDSIDDAAKLQTAMTQLGQSVKDQGGNWAELSKAVEEFAEVQERTTQFSRTEVIGSLKELTNTGMSVADAMKTVRVAEDAAAATGQSLESIVHSLMEAEHGRTQVLASLGLATRQQIKDGMSYNDVLALIEKNMGGAAEAMTNTLPGALAQLSNAFESMREDVGTPFLQLFTDIAHSATEFVESVTPEMQKFANELAQAAQDVVPAVEHWFSELWSTLQTVGQVIKSDVMPAFSDFAQILSPFVDTFENLVGDIQNSEDPWQQLRDLIKDAGSAFKDFADFLAAHQSEIETFFAVIIARQATSAVISLIGNLGNLKTAFMELSIVQSIQDGFTALQLVWEAASGAMELGLIPAIRAGIVALWDLYGAEVVATGGIMLIVGGIAELILHWHDVATAVEGAATTVLGWVGKIDDKISGLFDTISMGNPVLEGLAALFGHISDAANTAADNIEKQAQAVKDLQNAKSSDTREADARDSENWSSDPSTWGYHPQKPNKADPNTGVSTEIGGGTGKGSGSGFHATDAKPAAEDLNALKAAHDAVAGAARGDAAAHAALKETIDQTETSVQANAAVQQKLYVAYQNAHKAIPQLTADVAAETTQEHAAQQAVQEKYQAYVQATQHLDNLQKSLDGKNKLTKDEKKALEDAKNAQHGADDAYKSADTSLKSVTKSLDEHQKQLVANKKAIDDFVTAQQKMVTSFNDTIAKDREQQQEEEATYGMSLAQQVQYWQRKLAFDQDQNAAFFAQRGYWDQAMLQQESTTYTKLLQLQTKSYEDEKDAAKKAHDQAISDVSSFLDDIIEKHQSFASVFKSIWADIEKQYIADLAKMIAESALFSKVFGSIQKAFGLGSGGDNGNSQSLIGTPGSSASQALMVNVAGVSTDAGLGGNTTLDPNIAVSTSVIGAGIAAATGNSSGAVGGLINGLGNLFGGRGGGIPEFNSNDVYNVPTDDGGMTDANGVWQPTNGGNNAFDQTPGSSDSSLVGTPGSSATNAFHVNIAGIAQGAMIGSTIAGLDGGNQTWGTVGGAIGGAFFGPVGGAVGGFIGSLFGPHETAADQPDINEPINQLGNQNVNYAQLNADLQGVTGTYNGQQYTPSSEYNTATGGTSLEQQLENWEKNVNPSSLTPQEQQWLQQLQGYGSNLNITNEHQGVFTLADGQQVSVANFDDLVSQISQIPGAPGSGSGTAVGFNLTRTYPNYNIANVSAASASGVSSTSAASTTNVIHPNSDRNGAPQVNLDLSGAMIVGPNGMDEAIQTIATALKRLDSGEIAGGYAGSTSNRLTRSF